MAPEIAFALHDTIEYYYDDEVKGRFVCSIDCESPIDTVWWVACLDPLSPGQGPYYDYCLMQKQDGKYVFEFCPISGMEFDYFYCLSIEGWRYKTNRNKLHVHASNLDTIVP